MQDSQKKNPLFSDVLRLVAPGTQLREGLENVLRAKTGGLIVVGYGPEMKHIVDGGFSINCDFSPAHLYELAKMDGAIIVSEDAKRILYANTQLFPPASIATSETGTRHRTAQRTAIQTNYLVIAISQRRNVITLYQGNFRYVLNEISVILAKANQAVSTLEKYKAVLDQTLTNLGALEFEELVTLHEVTSVLQRVEMVLRIKSEVSKYICELGVEGRLVSMQLEELVSNIEEEAHMLIRDYCRDPAHSPDVVLRDMKKLSSDEMLELSSFLRVLGYSSNVSMLEESVSPRGFRILYKIPRLPMSIIANLVGYFHNLPRIMMATIEELDEVEGIGEVRARAIKDGLKRIQEQVFIDRHI
ncbi:DNA integrity scanning diadenylate cyclase DisA [Brevibacillus centrosporus]|uniref:DNA integrity scanning diadenylate cyclase DisA n=1 Tax=Brevibacillus centrosporus TaxID=54910 RepID=UPI000F0A6212|nr:DNA integrity scanning diadenylate cyclase DisA [Brevibacillus centrosporus]MEC2131956.1 DNA integrity scanning diadenylate cyclase DisA [Brevibacillus centrosporus]MED4912030.1 DNA integrity scanning diadenylate cyclase DisA [Brevibacillus centrosporus]RNB66014.1 DNA integrity scanning protein DisA [Brevibacillus centrosporus]GED33008.1 DNA integrity scanning protein DisA [Brevibacillus centrosporus]